MSEMTRLEKAARALLDDIHKRYPGEELRCPYMRELEAALPGGARDREAT